MTLWVFSTLAYSIKLLQLTFILQIGFPVLHIASPILN